VPVVMRVDLDSDGAEEYVLLMVGESRPSFAQFYYREDNRWRAGHLNERFEAGQPFDPEQILQGDMNLTAPRYRNLSIGGVELQPVP